MTLTLTVLRCPPSVAPETRQVTGGEFSIGRGTDNDWVLPDPDKHLSKRHCVIAYRRGEWQVAGQSTNGTFVNRDEEPVESRAPRPLEDGDRLRLGLYEIEVRLDETAGSRWSGAGFGGTAKPDPFGDDPFAADPFAPPPRAAPPSALDPFPVALPPGFDPLGPEDDEAYGAPTRPDHTPAVGDALNLPPTTPLRLPDDWDNLDTPAPRPAARPSESAPEPAPAPPPPPVAEPAGDLLAAFLRGAGMEDARPPDPVRTMEELGAAFRAVVEGIRQVLIARAEIKREFRIDPTVIRTRGNNPLKFSAGDDDALAGLLGAGRRTDMSAEEAVADALADIRLHELATMAAMQSAVRALVARLGPDPLRQAAEQGGGLPLPGARKARAWDGYEALHAKIARGLSDDFDGVFGRSFALAYEKAIDELVARRELRRDDGR